MSKAIYLSEVDAICSQKFDQARAEIQLMYGEMEQFQKHMDKNDQNVEGGCGQSSAYENPHIHVNETCYDAASVIGAVPDIYG